MADRPILFSSPMIRALLDGRKTQTRRLIKFDGIENVMDFVKVATDKEGRPVYEMKDAAGLSTSRPAGKHIVDYHYVPPIGVGDRLWVRESLSVDYEEGESYDPMGGVRESACGVAYGFARGPSIPYHVYAADHEYLEYPDDTAEPPMRGIPSIHMPKWASRLTLAVTDVRVERLLSITEAGAIAEGVIYENVIVDTHGSTGRHVEVTADRYWGSHEAEGFEGHETGTDAYLDLWDHINGVGSADKNPWVVAYTFTVHLGNINQIGRAE